jgi:hypothetical protein
MFRVLIFFALLYKGNGQILNTSNCLKAFKSVPIEVLTLGLDIVKSVAAFPLPLPTGSLFLPRSHGEICAHSEASVALAESVGRKQCSLTLVNIFLNMGCGERFARLHAKIIS